MILKATMTNLECTMKLNLKKWKLLFGLKKEELSF